jgi:cobalt-zinc-cadmium efflux system outer membrane protein
MYLYFLFCLQRKGALFTRCLAILLICITTSINSPGQDASAVQAGSGSDPMTADDLVRHALAANADLAAARLDIERRRARLLQAGLRPNPALDFEQQNGVSNSPGERATTVGISLPLELGGKRQRRIDLARAELEATESEVADRERRLANAVLAAHAEALAALHELSITEELNTVDIEGVRVVEARVNEGDAAPLELNLLRVEVDRLRSRRSLIEGRLRAAMLKLQSLAGMPLDRPLRLRESLPAVAPIEPPGSLESAIETALRTRPDLKLARLEEEVAQAGLRLARAQAMPDLSLFARYGTNLNTFDTTPIGPLTDQDRLLSFGVSIPLPIFNRNQGAKAEAATAITQAQRRREFVEQVVRAEVMGAYARYQSARNALATFEQGVITRSNENIRVIRGAYQIGGFRITELLNEQRRLLDAQREYTEALAERYRAWADLQTAIGVVAEASHRATETQREKGRQ